MTTRSSTQKAAIVQNIQMIVEGQCQRPRRSRRLLKYTIVRLEIQVIDTDNLKFSHGCVQYSPHPRTNWRRKLRTIWTSFGKEDTAKELRNHAAKTQDTSVDAVESTDVVEIEHAVCRALNELRAATTKGFDTKQRTIRLERIDHEQVVEKRQAASRAKK